MTNSMTHTVIVNHIIATDMIEIFFDRKHRNFPLKKIIDMEFTILEFFEDIGDGDKNPIDFVIFEDQLDNDFVMDHFDLHEFLTLGFETEEEALYFKLKYCS